ncbi:MAG TPA: SGNH/GDSL hydrolase family protein [Phototrophicaceae bacterium]|nr:SGNH/GDSL hydrolase family protein [Phototrophicaceae bacterium]
MKIVFLGDSLVWGGYGGDFVAEVARLLPEHTIINAGAGGNTVVNLLNRLDKVLEQQPDGVVVLVGGNDAISASQPATRPYYEQVQKIPGGVVSPESFAQTYRELLTRLHLAHVLVWIVLEPMEYSPELVAVMREYNALAAEAARALNVPALDLLAELPPAQIPPRAPLTLATINLIGKRTASGWADYETERQRSGFTYSFDGIHFTPAAARRVAATIVTFLDL